MPCKKAVYGIVVINLFHNSQDLAIKRLSHMIFLVGYGLTMAHPLNLSAMSISTSSQFLGAHTYVDFVL